MFDVAHWLAEQGLGHHVAAFAKNGIRGDVLRELTDSNLKEVGLNLGDRKRLLKAIAELDTKLSQHQGQAAEPTAAPPVPRQAERRQLTVMFVDMVGSTELAARLDPEDVREVMRAYQAACAGTIVRFGGHVARFLGDGVLAFFGWPQAHEDDAERAVRAGLATVEEVGRLLVGTEAQPAARIGIATGQVVVGDLTSRHTYDRDAVIGETPNLAARLQTLAESGTVVICEGTRRLIGGLFRLDDLGMQRLKGFAAPLAVWRVAGECRPERRFEAMQTTGLSPLVGRDKEISLLLRRWQQVADGKGQVVVLLGEPGIGKSRLALAAQRTIVDSEHFCVVLQCSSLHIDTALHPILAELVRVIRLRPRQPEDIARRRLRRLLSALMSETAVPLFARLLGLSEATARDLDGLRPELVKERTLTALLDLVERLSSRRPTLIIIEDAQWIDPTSRELLDALCERLSRLRVLLLVTARSGFAPAWLAADNCTSLTLRRLAKQCCATMVRQLCGARSLPPEDVERITTTAEGVPLFIEELSRAVLETRANDTSGNGPGTTTTLHIPATLRGLLTARLDQLGAAKEVVQVGSAIGRSFPVDLVRQAAAADEALVEEALERLVALGLATIRGRSRQRVCTFRHVLIQETAYQNMLRSLRRSVHRRIAELFEDGRDAHGVAPEILAHHYTEAGATADAVRKYHEAGQLAATRSANVEAARLLGRALQLLRSLPPGPERDEQELSILVSLGPVITTTSGPGASDVMELYERAIALCAGIRQSPSQFPAYWGWWRASPTFKVMRDRAET